jgi:hypothetical protein
MFVCLGVASLHGPAQPGWVRLGRTGATTPCLGIIPNWAKSMQDYVCLPGLAVSVPNHLPTVRMGRCFVAWTARHAAEEHSFHTQGNRAVVVTFEHITMAK